MGKEEARPVHRQVPTVLQVPAGEERGPGGLPNLLKEEEKDEDKELKKEYGDDDEEMEGREGMRRICKTVWWCKRA